MRHTPAKLLLGLAFLLFTVPAFGAERGVKRVETSSTVARHALVIGNSAYTQTAPLRNPVNDAKSMTSSLQALGFAVTTLMDSNQRAMDQAIRKFGKTLRNQGGGRSFLLRRARYAGGWRELSSAGGH